MLEARIRKHYPELIKKYFSNPNDFALSLKHVLECSVYNQGCDGGYSYLVSKFYKEFEMVLKDCYSDGCKKSCKNPHMEDLSFTISNFGYVGGSYGNCDEKQIMKEVYLNGPIVLSLEPDYSFMFYKSGVYQSPITSWITQKTKRPEWEKVDHSMVLVGWGVENINGKKVKYWILQNSWGLSWGENGFMKFIRGIDHLGIESICEYGMPIPKNNKS
jgi:cathepsin C